MPPTELQPGELVAVNKDTFVVYEKLPPEYDSRVKAMEVDERPTEEYSDIGGLDKQIEELVEAIVLPMTQKERFTKLGIRPPKGLLMHGPPRHRQNSDGSRLCGADQGHFLEAG